MQHEQLLDAKGGGIMPCEYEPAVLRLPSRRDDCNRRQLHVDRDGSSSQRNFLKLEHRPGCAERFREGGCSSSASHWTCYSSGYAPFLRPRPHAPRQSGAERLVTLIVCQLPAAASTFAAVFNAPCQWPAAASTLATSFNAVRTISSSSFASRRCVSSDACDWHACRCFSASSSDVLHSSDPKAF